MAGLLIRPSLSEITARASRSISERLCAVAASLSAGVVSATAGGANRAKTRTSAAAVVLGRHVAIPAADIFTRLAIVRDNCAHADRENQSIYNNITPG